MKIFLIAVLIVALALGIIGFLIEALLWLALLGLVLFVGTVVFWWARAKWSRRREGEATA